MFRFFRKIRSAALFESRLVRYLLYALGEIALVVIGILIALYLDEQKDYREDRRQERIYLVELQRDLERNLEELDRVIAKSGKILKACDSVISYSQRAPEEVPEDSLLVFMGDLMGYTKHMTRQGTIEDLLGSGKLDVIRNDSIRRAVATWEADLKLSRELEEDAKMAFQSYAEYLDLHIPMYERPNMENVKKELLPQMLYLNQVTNRAITIDYLHHTYLKMQPRWQRLLETVGQELQADRHK